MNFSLHPRLAADCQMVTSLDLCAVLLMNDANYPWLVMVPKRPDLREIHDLSPVDQQTLMAEISHTSKTLQDFTGAGKMNVAALGNQVPQLHIHVIARFESDAAWPGPVWGVVPAKPYAKEAMAEMATQLSRVFNSLK